jgi:hypothetical protein
VRRAVAFPLAAAAPDFDLLFHAHSGPTHGLGAALLAGVIVWAGYAVRVWMTRRPGQMAAVGGGAAARRFALAVAAAYATHTLLDWLGSDTSPPIGIMALWPMSDRYFESPLHVFMAISRRYWLPEFWTSNIRAMAREVAILGPILGLTVWRRGK